MQCGGYTAVNYAFTQYILKFKTLKKYHTPNTTTTCRVVGKDNNIQTNVVQQEWSAVASQTNCSTRPDRQQLLPVALVSETGSHCFHGLSTTS
jgi:hypothetical protein